MSTKTAVAPRSGLVPHRRRVDLPPGVVIGGDGLAGLDEGPILDATLGGITAAAATVRDLIERVRAVNDSLTGSAMSTKTTDSGNARADAPEPSGRAYVANVRIGNLRNALDALSDEVQRLERL